MGSFRSCPGLFFFSLSSPLPFLTNLPSPLPTCWVPTPPTVSFFLPLCFLGFQCAEVLVVLGLGVYATNYVSCLYVSLSCLFPWSCFCAGLFCPKWLQVGSGSAYLSLSLSGCLQIRTSEALALLSPVGCGSLHIRQLPIQLLQLLTCSPVWDCQVVWSVCMWSVRSEGNDAAFFFSTSALILPPPSPQCAPSSGPRRGVYRYTLVKCTCRRFHPSLLRASRVGWCRPSTQSQITWYLVLCSPFSPFVSSPPPSQTTLLIPCRPFRQPAACCPWTGLDCIAFHSVASHTSNAPPPFPSLLPSTPAIASQTPPPPIIPLCSLWRQHDALVLLALDHLERLHKVLPARLDRGRVSLVAGQVGVNELDEAVEVLGRDLSREGRGSVSKIFLCVCVWDNGS